MKNIRLFLAITGLLISTAALAGECVFHVTRTACPGQETQSYAKCNGAQSCDVTVADGADNETACAAAVYSDKGCLNSRTNITKYKSVTATFNGRPLSEDADYCAQDSSTYTVAANYPFRNSPACE